MAQAQGAMANRCGSRYGYPVSLIPCFFMTNNGSTRLLVGLALQGVSAVIVGGVCQVIEDRGLARSSILAFLAIGCVATIAPAFYGLHWLRGRQRNIWKVLMRELKPDERSGT